MNADALDLERENFLRWYRRATPEDLEIARAHGAERLAELMRKYAGEVRFIGIVKEYEQLTTETQRTRRKAFGVAWTNSVCPCRKGDEC